MYTVGEVKQHVEVTLRSLSVQWLCSFVVVNSLGSQPIFGKALEELNFFPVWTDLLG